MTGITSPDVIGLDSPGEHCFGAAVVVIERRELETAK
jgi:hypothetical protein